MIYLLQFDSQQSQLERLQEFVNLREAEAARLDLELDLHRQGISREVVLLEAESEGALRKTHGRYFETPEQLVAASQDAVRQGTR